MLLDFQGHPWVTTLLGALMAALVALALHHVRTVDPGRGDADQHLAGTRLRHGTFDNAQHVRSARLARIDRRHCRGDGVHRDTLIDFPCAPC